MRGVSQSSLIGLLTAPPSLGKHVNVIELHGDIKNNGGCGRLSRRKVRRAPLLLSVWPQRADVEAGLGSENTGGGLDKERKRKARGERSKGFTARSLAFQVMDMHVSV